MFKSVTCFIGIRGQEGGLSKIGTKLQKCFLEKVVLTGKLAILRGLRQSAKKSNLFLQM